MDSSNIKYYFLVAVLGGLFFTATLLRFNASNFVLDNSYSYDITSEVTDTTYYSIAESE